MHVYSVTSTWSYLKHSFVLLAALTSVAGCSGSDTGAMRSPVERGTYEIRTWTVNPQNCDTEGASVLEKKGHETSLGLSDATFFGMPYLHVNSFQSFGLGEDPGGMTSYNPSLDIQFGEENANVLHGESVMAGSNPSGSDCVGSLTNHVLEYNADEHSIRIESRTTKVTFAKDAEGRCMTDGAKAAAKGKACSDLRVVTATHAG